jgi:hypothetical protein
VAKLRGLDGKIEGDGWLSIEGDWWLSSGG